ncbi:hypothetical protein F7725_003862 [Dissostichus mawsoni]|uniref:Ribosomal RNA-processing protein 7 C-terminal domain-containing protein n=1 Tax=Dissostichus mawsoni TaxID=36200 RepID=A0A7J5YBG6_DISMA|nr:hypothetical protein F7725_003862 [Dissostichus mawsoni]
MAPSKKKHASNQACVIPGGFTVLSVQFNSDSVAQHKLYVKEHKVRSERSSHRPMDRTLFDVAKQMFSQFGSVQSVELRDHPGSSQDSGPKMSKFFRPAAKQQYTESFIHTDNLQKIVDSFMEGYDKRKKEEEEKQKEEAEQQQEDEEGWVKVTRGTKARPHSEAANKKTLQKEIRKKKRKELMNFYTWQHRNTQKEHIAELRKKFEEDKQRIALLRAQRKFKPY